MFFQILFPHNNISILGKPEGKEKQQDSLEYNVSKATALWFYQDLQSQSPGRDRLSGACPAASTVSTPQLWRGQKAQAECPSQHTSFIFPIKKHLKSSKGDAKRKKKKKYWRLVLAMQQTERKQNQLPHYKLTQKSCMEPSKASASLLMPNSKMRPLPNAPLRKEEVCLHWSPLKIFLWFGEDTLPEITSPSNTSLGCLSRTPDTLFVFKEEI